ncbi:MAG: ferritin family protein [Bacteroidetes bacterium]|nr:ferritin family protein [Bacteroidota bacterium]
MKAFENIDEVLDFAMNAEQEAVDFYTQLASVMSNQQMKETFLEFAKEEIKHKARLEKIKEEKIFEQNPEKVADLKIADYTVNVTPSPNMNYADALVLAMKKEKAAFRLYYALAERTTNPELKKVFEELAIEESKHKLKFEIEYDEHVLRDN